MRSPRREAQPPDPRAANGHASAPPAVRPGPRPRPWDWRAHEGPTPASSPFPTGPRRALESRAAPSSLAVQGSTNSCLKALLQFSAVRGRLFRAHLPTLKIQE